MAARSFEDLRQLHPCLSDTEGKTGRLHLPVSPFCNLGCRYCKRTFTRDEERPGTSRGILPVDMVPKIMRRALELCPEITTVGIAGPGEALASDHALKAFRIVDELYPQMIKCLSTNGLLLNERADGLAEAHMDSVTVTVNAVDPAIQAQINEKIFYHGEWMTGERAAEILIDNQIQGIKRIADLGMTVKINTVLIPGLNDRCIGEIAKMTAAAGALMHNIIPLIPQAQMKDLAAPGCDEVNKARNEAGKYLTVFSHCRHCRADAAGILGKEDFGRMIYGEFEPVQETFSHG